MRRFGAERRGAAAVEFALVLPLLLMILFGIVQFGITFNNYIQLTDAVRVGARALAVARTGSTPYSSTTSAITASAPALTAGSISPTITINGTACASDTACKTAMTSAAGLSASVTATYPCNLVVMGVNYGPGCTLSATTTEMIE